MTTIRPNLFPQAPQQRPQAEDSAKLAAQRAFFSHAMGQAEASAATVAPAAAATAAPVRRMAEIPAEAPQKILRPGSLIDIRI